MTDITEIIILILGIISAVLTAFILPYLKSKIGKEKYSEVSRWVTVAVSAAEMVYSEAKKSGADKKNYVLDFLQKNGVTYDASKINALIEAAVLSLKNKEQ